MTRATILDEAQGFLLSQGDLGLMDANFPSVRRRLAQLCPVLATVRQTITTWVFGQYTHQTPSVPQSSFVDDTIDAQDVGTSDAALSTLVAGDGHMIGAYGLFETVQYTIGTAAVGAPVWEYTYWNGETWQILPTLAVPNFSATGAQTLRFIAPENWRYGKPVNLNFPVSVLPERYWIRVRATTAPSTAPLASLLTIRIATYPIEEGVIALLAAVWVPNELEPAAMREGLDLLLPTWRTQEDSVPRRFNRDAQSSHLLRLSPIPTTLGAPNVPFLPGVFANNNLAILSIDDPSDAAMPAWFESLCSYAVAGMESRRLSDTRDEQFASGCDALVTGLAQVLTGLWRDEGIELLSEWQSPMGYRSPDESPALQGNP